MLEVVAINDSGGVKQASHLVKYDSVLGTFEADVKIVDDTHMSIDGKSIQIVSSRDPLQLPWKELGIDIVIEGTGVFIDTPGASKHLTAGAKKVVITRNPNPNPNQVRFHSQKTFCEMEVPVVLSAEDGSSVPFGKVGGLSVETYRVN